MGTYGQYCPIARSSELLAERWTPVIVRNLLNGCRTFGEIREGAGRALGPVCDALGQWGARWLELEPRHLDPAYVLWATVKLVDVEALPAGTTTVRVRLIDHPDENYWMILRRPTAELCTRGAGLIEDLVCETDAQTLVALHLRRTTYSQTLRAGRLRLEGPPTLQRRFSAWFRTSPFADYLPDASASSPARRQGD